jgi:hypothetical protein
MKQIWTAGLAIALITATIACGTADRTDGRTPEDTRGTAGRGGSDITATGCIALGQMGTYMLTSEEDVPTSEGFGRAAATRGYQLLGQADDFNQYMNKRVRVTGTTAPEAREEPDSNSPAATRDGRAEAPWPKLQVREVEPIGGECKTR